MKETVVTVPLKNVESAPRTSRAKKAINEVRKVLSKQFNVSKDDIYLDSSLNEKIWERGIQKPPSKIKVLVRKFEDGVVEAELANE